MSAPSIGVFLPTLGDPSESPADIIRAARHAEDLGFETVWAIDQLIAGTGASIIDSTVALTAAAAATSRIRLGFGVVILPLRPPAWVAKQVASLQHISGNRVILGVGAGGDRHEQSWFAAGVPRTERGRRTDAALRVLPDLIAGKPANPTGDPGGPEVQLTPGAAVPPIVVGGMSDPAVARAVEHGDGWFLLPTDPAGVADARARVTELAAARGRPTPRIIASVMSVIDGDPALPDDATLRRSLSDPDGRFGIPDELIDDMVVRDGPAGIAERLSAHGESGAGEIVFTVAAGNWFRQTELLADARSMLN